MNQTGTAKIGAIVADKLMDEDQIVRDERRAKLEEENATATTLGITIARLREIRAFAANLHRKYPQMSPARIQRKTAEYFKIKLAK